MEHDPFGREVERRPRRWRTILFAVTSLLAALVIFGWATVDLFDVHIPGALRWPAFGLFSAAVLFQVGDAVTAHFQREREALPPERVPPPRP